MKIIQNNTRLITLIVLSIFAGLYLVWQLIGLRYTNHNDIYFHLYSWIFSGDYLSFAEKTASVQARVQAYINMPILLWANSFQNSVFFDVLNIGSFGILYLGLIWLLARIDNTKNSLAIATATLLLFPLHYYFTFPQGYPLMAQWGLAFAFLSLALFASYLQQQNLWKLIVSTFLFTLSLWGPEYNFVLHPALLFLVFLSLRKLNFKDIFKSSWPYVIGWMASIVIYFFFSMIARENGANSIGKVSFGFDFIGWMKTFFILQEKAFLPFALWTGIRLTSATTQGSPEIPDLITFSTILAGTYDWLSIFVVFSLICIIFAVILLQQNLSIKSIRFYSIFFTCLTIIPSLVVSGSIHYQLIVLKGHIQGHLVSFYSQLGLSGLFFLFLIYLCNIQKKKYLRVFAIALSTMLIACFATITFIYNHANRQIMIANKQKWQAMYVITKFVHQNRTDLVGRTFYAPAFLSVSGVSKIPGLGLSDAENYWTEYTINVLDMPLRILNSDNSLTNDSIILNYFSTPTGTPVSVLSEKITGDHQWRITLLASQPISGTVTYQRNGNRRRKISIDQWKCSLHCVVVWEDYAAMQQSSIYFDPDDHGPERLLSQFISDRKSNYAHPFVHLSNTK